LSQSTVRKTILKQFRFDAAVPRFVVPSGPRPGGSRIELRRRTNQRSTANESEVNGERVRRRPGVVRHDSNRREEVVEERSARVVQREAV